ncbi:MAG TPA: zf-TFIIB domain-containing protein [Sphingomonadales bacterium]
MKCPNDEAVLQVVVREGIEIDYCPRCRGVWLERGELEKIIERTGIEFLRYDMPRARSRQMTGHHKGPDHHDDEDDDHGPHPNLPGYLFNF